ncbi:MAG: DUF1801 domain-containing protein [Thermomicrobiales bacterium]
MGKIVTIEEYIESLAESLREIATQLRPLMDKEFPKATGKVWHGHPMWMVGKHPVAGFKAYTSYVTYMIWRGQEHSEAAVPRDMASHKLASVADIEEVQAADWLREEDVA